MQHTPSRSSGEPEKHDDLTASSRNDSDLSEPIIDHTLEKTVWRKLDLWILPVVAMFYFLSFLVSTHFYLCANLMNGFLRITMTDHSALQDRTNFANARVAGLQTNLKMTNTQYSIALTVTYVPYIAAELPSNLLLKVSSIQVEWLYIAN